MAVSVVCATHGGVSRNTVVSPDGNVTVSHKGNETIVRDSAGNVSEVSGDAAVSNSDVSGGNYRQTVTNGGNSSQSSSSGGSAVSSASAVSSVSSSQSSSQSSQ